MVQKIGNKWCVVHAHPMKPSSKTDKPIGTPIYCYSIDKYGEEEAKKKADKMHQAILISEDEKK